VYQASVTLLVSQGKAAAMDQSFGYYDAERLAATYSRMLGRRAVIEEVARNLGLADDPAKLGKAVSAEPVRDTQLIELTVEDTDGARAAPSPTRPRSSASSATWRNWGRVTRGCSRATRRWGSRKPGSWIRWW
jgi:uncharacterized protein involved in exopolysaccharide biosynthesis